MALTVGMWQEFINEMTNDAMSAVGHGMQVADELKEGERKVMEYLLSPVRKAMGESGRVR